MTPKMMDETRNYFETEIAFWQAKANDFVTTQFSALDQLGKEYRARHQAAAEAQAAATAELVRHTLDAANRGATLFTRAFAPSF